MPKTVPTMTDASNATDEQSKRRESRGWHHRVNNMLTVLTNHSELLLINLDRGEYSQCHDSAIKMRDRLFELDEYLREVAAQATVIDDD